MADEIDAAAARIEAHDAAAIAAVLSRPTLPPSSGICCDCGDAIEADRLAVHPSARLCQGCAEDAEHEAALAKRRGRR